MHEMKWENIPLAPFKQNGYFLVTDKTNVLEVFLITEHMAR